MRHRNAGHYARRRNRRTVFARRSRGRRGKRGSFRVVTNIRAVPQNLAARLVGTRQRVDLCAARARARANEMRSARCSAVQRGAARCVVSACDRLKSVGGKRGSATRALVQIRGHTSNATRGFALISIDDRRRPVHLLSLLLLPRLFK